MPSTKEVVKAAFPPILERFLVVNTFPCMNNFIFFFLACFQVL